MNRETKIISGLFIFLVAIFVVSVISISSKIEDAGGAREVVVKTGKSIKSIYQDIKEESP